VKKLLAILCAGVVLAGASGVRGAGEVAADGSAESVSAPADDSVADAFARQRTVLAEMIELNKWMSQIRDRAIKQDRDLRAWAQAGNMGAEFEARLARKAPELAEMQAKFDTLKKEFKELQAKVRTSSDEDTSAVAE